MLVPDFTDDFLDQVLDGDQAGDAAIFVDDNREADVMLPHLAQQVTAQLTLGDEIQVLAHERFDRARAGFGVGYLKDILRVHNADNVVDGVAVDGNAREWLGAQQFNEFFDRGIGGHGHHLRPRLHGFPYGFAAELDHRLNQVAVTGLNDAFFLPSFDEGIHGFGGTLGLFF